MRNANLARLREVKLSRNSLITEIVQILVNEGFIESFSVLDDRFLLAKLKYKGLKQKPYITNIVLVSKPGLRVYVNSKRIPKIWGGVGLCLFSARKFFDCSINYLS